MDLGTGDGRAVLAAAVRDPDALVIGVDADAATMAESSRRAAGPIRRHGLPNAIFVASGVDRLPVGLDGLAAAVAVHFPWGSLLRGALGLDPAMTRSIARVVAPAGSLTIAISLLERDAVAGRPSAPFLADDVAEMERAFACHQLRLDDAHEMTPAEVAATGSTWGRRLRAGIDRPAWLVRFRRDDEPPDGVPSAR